MTHLKLSDYIRLLLKIYQDEDIEGLAKHRETRPKHELPIWEIPKDIKRDLISSSSEEESAQNNEHIEIPTEMLLRLKNQPAWQNPKLAVNPIKDLDPNEDPNQTKSLTCFPAKASWDTIIEAVNRKQPSQSQPQTNDSVHGTEVVANISITNPQNNTLSSISKQTKSISPKNENSEQTNPNNDDKNVVQRYATNPNDSESHKSYLIFDFSQMDDYSSISIIVIT